MKNNLHSYYNTKELEKEASEEKAKLQEEVVKLEKRKIEVEATSQIRCFISKIVQELLTAAEKSYPITTRLAWDEKAEKKDFWADLFHPKRFYGLKSIWRYGLYWFSVVVWEISVYKSDKYETIRTYLTINGQIFQDHLSYPTYLEIEKRTIDDGNRWVSNIDLSEDPKDVRDFEFFKSICSDLVNKAEVFGITQEKIQEWKTMLQDIS